MAEVLLFHHAQGLIAGVRAFADDLRAAGHTVHTPDLFDGRLFPSITEGLAYIGKVGFDEMRERGVRMADGLPPGLVLLEGSIAGLLKTSRAPVQAALRILEEEDLVRRFEGRGYLVGGAKSTEKPLRTDLTKLGLSVSDEIDSALQNRGLWERVYEEVETAVAASLVFGDFRIIESELGDYYGVSRTVVRDVLSRLHERGLIAKTASSHWVVNALTAQSVRERFKLREILEPEALRL